MIKTLKKTLGILTFSSLLCLSVNLPAQITQTRFEHVSVEDGLSQNSILCVLQDKTGYLWIGTQDGLNRYDGYEFKIWRPIEENENSLSHGVVQALVEDEQGYIWIGTRNGLNRYDPVREQFVQFYHDPEDSLSLSHNYVVSLLIDRAGKLWVGTYGGGLNLFHRDSGKFTHFRHDEENPFSISHNAVKVIYEDSAGRMWIGTATGGSGVNLFDRSTNRFLHALNSPDQLACLNMRSINTIQEDVNGHLWIGSWHHGVLHFDPETYQYKRYFDQVLKPGDDNNVITTIQDPSGFIWIGLSDGGVKRSRRKISRDESVTPEKLDIDFIHYRSHDKDAFGLLSNRINCMQVDRFGILWIGSMDNGLNKVDLYSKPFRYIGTDAENLNTTAASSLSAFVEDNQNRLWIGTRDGGLYRYDLTRQTWKRYTHDPDDKNSLAFNDIIELCWDPGGVIWLGNPNRGLNRFDLATEKFRLYRQEAGKSGSLSSNSVHELFLDRSGDLWVGTYGGGANRYNYSSDDFSHFPVFPSQGRRNAVVSFLEDRSGTFWMGTPDLGLIKLDRSSGEQESYALIPGPSQRTLHQYHVLFESEDRTLWIGTNGAGLIRFDRATEDVRIYTKAEGLPNNIIHGILEDDRGRLWLSTEQGITRFSPGTEVFRNYNIHDGLSSNIFRLQAAQKRDNGEFIFGSENGLIIFHPDSINDNETLPELVITEMKLFNKSFNYFERLTGSDFASQVNANHHIELSHEENFFSFEFSAMHYAAPQKNRYAYILENFDKEWMETDAENRQAVYTNVNPGQYVFRVKGCNNDGYWNDEGYALAITIHPPLWGTRWFQALFLLLGIGAVFGLFRYRLRNVQRRSRELEKINLKLGEQIKIREEKEKQVRESLEEKMILLHEVHHRVKNNLQVINSLLSLQSENVSDPEVKRMFDDSRQRVLSMALVHEKLYRTEDFLNINISEYIKSLVSRLLHTYSVGPSPIETQIKVDETITMTVDVAIPCGLIINELVSNALKYAFPEEFDRVPEIHVSLEQVGTNGGLLLIVKDNGVGLPDGFDVKTSSTLGFQLVRTLTEVQMRGKLSVKNESGLLCHISLQPAKPGNSSQE